MTEVVTVTQEVPHTLVEEVLVEVPQVQTAEIIRQVQMPVVQTVQRQVPRITTQVVEKVQQVAFPLINEVAQEVPQVQTIEVLKQTAVATSQRIVQQGVQYERAVQRETVLNRVEASQMTGTMYEAGIVGVRENVAIQPTVVERVSPMTITNMQVAAPATGYVQAATGYEVDQINAYGQVVERDLVVGGGVVETFAAPTFVETFAAPTVVETIGATGLVETVVAPTTYMGATGLVETVVAPTTYIQ
jgi:hypothetical protein